MEKFKEYLKKPVEWYDSLTSDKQALVVTGVAVAGVFILPVFGVFKMVATLGFAALVFKMVVRI